MTSRREPASLDAKITRADPESTPVDLPELCGCVGRRFLAEYPPSPTRLTPSSWIAPYYHTYLPPMLYLEHLRVYRRCCLLFERQSKFADRNSRIPKATTIRLVFGVSSNAPVRGRLDGWQQQSLLGYSNRHHHPTANCSKTET